MPSRRLAIADPQSLMGTELMARLPGVEPAPAEVVLLDREERRGTLVEYDGEAAVLGTLDADGLEGVDVLVVCGLADIAQGLLGRLRDAGTIVVDLTGQLSHPDARVVLPSVAADSHEDGWLFQAPQPASTAIARILSGLGESTDVLSADCVLLHGVSDLGHAGIDELHAQTVAALNFKSTTTTVLGTRLAFNVVPAARAARQALEARVRTEVSHLLQGGPELTVTAIRVPVFFGAGLHLALTLDDTLPARLAAELLGEISGVAAAVDHPVGIGDSTDDPTGGPIHVSVFDGDPDGHLRMWVAYDELRHGRIGTGLEIIAALATRG